MLTAFVAPVKQSARHIIQAAQDVRIVIARAGISCNIKMQLMCMDIDRSPLACKQLGHLLIHKHTHSVVWYARVEHLAYRKPQFVVAEQLAIP